jgi:hypothetical protein
MDQITDTQKAGHSHQIIKALLDLNLEPVAARDFVRTLNTDFPAHPASPLPRLAKSRARFGKQCTPEN